MRRITLALLAATTLATAACVQGGAATPAGSAPSFASPGGPAGPTASAVAEPTAGPTPEPSATDDLFPGAVGTPFPTQAGMSVVTSTPNGATNRITFDALVFDVPSSWTVRQAGVNEHYIQVIGFVGTAPSVAGCFPMSFAPPQTGATGCAIDLRLGQGQISIALQTQDGPPRLVPLGVPETLQPGDQLVHVDGVPAIRNNDNDYPIPNANLAISLRIQDPLNLNRSMMLTAGARGTGAEALMQQASDVFATIHFATPPKLPDTSPANERRVIGTAIKQFATYQPGYDCFPLQAGGSTTASITKVPGQPDVSRPVAVTCRTDLEVVGAFWKVTFAIEWGKPGDEATSSTQSSYLLADGTPTWYSGFSKPLP